MASHNKYGVSQSETENNPQDNLDRNVSMNNMIEYPDKEVKRALRSTTTAGQTRNAKTACNPDRTVGIGGGRRPGDPGTAAAAVQ